MTQQPTRDLVPEAATPRVAVETNGINVIDGRHRLKKYDVIERGDEIYVSI